MAVLKYVDKSNNTTVYYTRDTSGNIYNLNNEKLKVVSDGVYYDESNLCMLDLRRDLSNYICGGDSKTLAIKVERKLYLDSSGVIVQAQCPFYTNYTYPLLDGLIAKVTDYGTTEEQKNLNFQNLKFETFRKVSLNYYYSSNYSLIHSVLLGDIAVSSSSNPTYKYALFLKTDPFGTVQRWLSNNIYGEYKQIDDLYYPYNPQTVTSNGGTVIIPNGGSTDIGASTCSALITTSHPELFKGNNISVTNQTNIVFDRHFEGSDMQTFSGKYYLFTDHYVGAESNEEIALYPNYTDAQKTQIRRKHQGIYYSLVNNTDVTDSSSHLLYNAFKKITVNNTSLRPVSNQYNVIRNGGVFRPNKSTDLTQFKKDMQKASKFNASYKVYPTNDTNKVIVVIKANRAINPVPSGFKRISDDLFVSGSELYNANTALYDMFNKYKTKSLPYSYETLYLYKIVDKSSGSFTVEMCDKYKCTGNATADNKVTLTINPSSTMEPMCPTIKGVTTAYDGSSKSISVSGLTGGTIQYRTSSNGTWSTTKPGRTNPGLTNVYVQVVSGSKTVDCNYVSIKVDPKISIPATPTDKAYNGKEQSSGITCPSGTIASGTIKSTNAGKYTQTCTITDTSTYQWSDGTTAAKNITWNITALSISDATITNVSDKTYTGSAITQNPIVQKSVGGVGTTLKNNTDYVISYANNTNIGTATITVTGKGNFTGTKSTTFNIINNSVPVPTSSGNKTYNGVEQASGISCPSGSNTSGVTKATNVGSYTQICTLTSTQFKWDDGTTAAKNITWKIVALDMSDATITNVTDKTYTGSAITQNPVVQKNVGSVVMTLNNNIDYNITYTNNTNVGTATMIITGKGNFTGTKSISFVISKGSLPVPVSPSNKFYNGNEQKSGVICPSGTTSGGTTKATNAGTYTHTCTITDTSKYMWNDGTNNVKNISWTISPLDINDSTISGVENKKYTGSAITQKPIVKINVNGTVKTLVNGTDYTVSYANNINIGNATMTVTGKGNYVGTKTVTFNISNFNLKIKNYRESGNNISKITDKTSIINYKEHFESDRDIQIKVYYSNLTELNTSNVIPTGSITKIYLDNVVQREYINSVIGDVSGDGYITPLDYVKVKKHLMEENILKEEPFILAADYNSDDKISPLDYVGIKNYIMKGNK